MLSSLPLERALKIRNLRNRIHPGRSVLVLLLSIFAQGIALYLDADTIIMIFCFIITCLCNMILLSWALPPLLSKIVRSNEVIFIALSMFEYCFCGCQLAKWDKRWECPSALTAMTRYFLTANSFHRAILYASIFWNVLASLLLQDGIVLKLEVRAKWRAFYSGALATMEIMSGAFLVFGIYSVEGVAEKDSFLSDRMYLSFAMDALSTILMFTARSAIKTYFYPELLVTLSSDVEFRQVLV